MNQKQLKEFHQLFSSSGGKATKKKYGREHFQKMGQISGESKRRVKEMAQQGQNISSKTNK